MHCSNELAKMESLNNLQSKRHHPDFHTVKPMRTKVLLKCSYVADDYNCHRKLFLGSCVQFEHMRDSIIFSTLPILEDA